MPETDALLEIKKQEILNLRRRGEHVSLPILCQDHPELIPTLVRWIAQLTPATAYAPADDPTTLPPEAAPPPAAADLGQVGEYDLLRELEAGGMGVVYEARDLESGKTVALKMIRAGDRATKADRERFRVETLAALRLQSQPHIVKIKKVGEHQGQPYFVMEWAAGGTLAERLRAGRLAPDAAADLLLHLARAMQYAHDQEILHRDLKPGNVLFTADGTPRISDFGLAKRLEADASQGGTVHGQVMGTPAYMPPEQAAGDWEKVQAWSDVYSLGAILYECLTGRPPFQGPIDVVLAQVRLDAPTPPTFHDPDVPQDLEAICLKCLEKAPEDRYRTAAALAEDLARFRRGEQVHADRVSVWGWWQRWGDRYEILRRVGEGQHGPGWLARHRGTREVRFLQPLVCLADADAHTLGQLRGRYEVAFRLGHPQLARTDEVVDFEGRLYAVTEDLPGGTLAECGLPLRPLQAARFVEEVARAIHHLHQQGLIHGDLKPSHLRLTAAGLAKVTDYRLAHRLDVLPARGPSRTLAGSPSYMAPEQADGRVTDYGPPTDVYGLGATLYELLTGRPPFRGANIVETLEQVRRHEPLRPSTLRIELPRDLDLVCLMCLEKEPRRRYGTAAELADDLARFQAGEPVRARLWKPGPVEGSLQDPVTWPAIPGYEILGVLGQGALGVVYRAWQLAMGRMVALKVLGHADRLGPVIARRFLAANRALGRLQHPHLVRVYDCGDQNGLLYLVRELADGEGLAARLSRGPLLAVPAARLAALLARTVHYLHGRHILHRNLKPGAVVRTEFGVPLLTSFERARLLYKALDPVEEDGDVVGTPSYMAPEQAEGRTAQQGPPTDVYGLGATLYHVVTGRPPFQAESNQETLIQVRRDRPLPPTYWRPDLPDALEAIILRCLQKRPDQRYPTAQDLAEALEAFAGRGEVNWE